VTDSEQRGSSIDAQQDYGQPQDARARKKQQDAAADKGREADSRQKGNRSSIDWGKPVLGRFDDVKQNYSFDKVLGKGQFGVTRLVVDTNTGERCACKSISKRKLVSQEDMEDVRREIKVMHHLSGHPHVVTFKGGVYLGLLSA
jgi:calcium-dependent protein kinase